MEGGSIIIYLIALAINILIFIRVKRFANKYFESRADSKQTLFIISIVFIVIIITFAMIIASLYESKDITNYLHSAYAGIFLVFATALIAITLLLLACYLTIGITLITASLLVRIPWLFGFKTPLKRYLAFREKYLAFIHDREKAPKWLRIISIALEITIILFSTNSKSSNSFKGGGGSFGGGGSSGRW